MALFLADRVQETTNTTGTGTLTLAGAVSGFQSFAAIGNANTTYYTIVSGTDWETGIGTYTLSGTTLSRDTVLESSSAGAKISVASGATVFCTYPADRAVFLDTQAANTVYAAPNGSSGNPTFRSLVSADIPDLLLTKLPEAWTKMSCHAATTANITLSGTQTVDGVALVAGNRCLVKNQTAAQDNGIYEVSAGAWTRTADANTASKITGAAINVDSGTLNGGKLFDTDFKATDTLGTTAMNFYSFVDTNGATFTGTVTARAGTATAGTAPIYLQSGTNLTNAEAGAIEYNGTLPFFTPFGTSRGVMPSEQFIVLGTPYTLTSQTAAQKMFNNTTKGAVAVAVGTYYFECFYSLSSMSATSGSFGFSLNPTGATATIGSQVYISNAVKSGASIGTAATLQSTVQTGGASTLATASTQTVGYALIRGMVRITGAGTIIPAVSLTVAAAAIVGANSYFRIYPVSASGSGAVTVGNWS